MSHRHQSIGDGRHSPLTPSAGKQARRGSHVSLIVSLFGSRERGHVASSRRLQLDSQIAASVGTSALATTIRLRRTNTERPSQTDAHAYSNCGPSLYQFGESFEAIHDRVTEGELSLPAVPPTEGAE